MKAIFFDLDGVLINSEIIHQNIIKEFLITENYNIPPERFYLLIGSHKSLNPWDKILEGIDLKESKDDFLNKLRQYRINKIKEIEFGNFVFPEVEQTLIKLKENNIKIACASSSNKNYILNTLKKANIYKYFDLVVSCDDFTKSKPNPEIYIFCKNYFNINNKDCLIVEDSAIGIEAGKNANITTLARKDNYFNINQSRADYIINDLTDLLKLI